MNDIYLSNNQTMIIFLQTLNCLSLKISTQNLIPSVSCCLQHTTKCHMLLRNGKLFTLSGTALFQLTTISIENAFSFDRWVAHMKK